MISKEELQKLKDDFIEILNNTSYNNLKDNIIYTGTNSVNTNSNNIIFKKLQSEGLNLSNKEIMYLKLVGLEEFLKYRYCPTCGKVNKLARVSVGYPHHCSLKCSKNDIEIENKIEETNLKRYGKRHAMQANSVKEKRDKTCIEKYGVENPLSVKEIRDKGEQTMIERYGVYSASKCEELMEKRKKTVLERYGVENVRCNPLISQKIKDTNNILYGGNAPICSDDVKEKVFDNDYYNGLILKFSNEELIKEYNRYQKHNGDYSKTSQSNKIILHFQTNFYAKERKLWEDDNIKQKLIANRIKYIGKGYGELTISEILTGFKVSGICPSKYSHFNPLWIKKFISDYNVSSIYDPCGGWGHRLIGVGKDFKYHYNDINTETFENTMKISSFFDMTNKTFSNCDSASYIPEESYDAIFTCPPYHNIERYSDKGAENLKYEDFISWWEKTVENCLSIKPRIFSFVMKENYIDDMTKLLDSKLKLLNKIPVGNYNIKSHFVRYNNKENRQKEIMVVYGKN